MSQPLQLTDVHRNWAAETLEFSATANQTDLRRSALDRLSQADFAPTDEVDLAIRVLCGESTGRLSPSEWTQLNYAHEQAGKAEVEAFCENFFQLPVQERRVKQNELIKRYAAHPRLLARLWELEPGLELQVSPELAREAAMPAPEELAQIVLKILTSDRIVKLRLIRDLKRRQRENHFPWRREAINLRNTWPELFALSPQLIASLEHAPCTAPYIVAHRSVQVPRPKRLGSPKQPRELPPRHWWGLVLVVLAIMASMVVRDTQKNSAPPSRFRDEAPMRYVSPPITEEPREHNPPSTLPSPHGDLPSGGQPPNNRSPFNQPSAPSFPGPVTPSFP